MRSTRNLTDDCFPEPLIRVADDIGRLMDRFELVANFNRRIAAATDCVKIAIAVGNHILNDESNIVGHVPISFNKQLIKLRDFSTI